MIQWRKSIASWKVGKTLYLSVPFTWLLPEAEKQSKEHKGPVFAGGPAVSLAKKNGCFDLSFADTPDKTPFDTLALHNPLATFTTRGCPNSCPFCAVPKIEGEFRQFDKWKPAPMICDNNILAGTRSHFSQVIRTLKRFPYADFNQGLDARLLTIWHVMDLCELKAVKIRFAFDDLSEETAVHDAIEMCRRHGLDDLGVYCLYGFNDTPESARYRLDLVRSWGIRPNAMRYQPLDTLTKNSYVAPGWTEKQLRKVSQYYNRLRWNEFIPFDEFERGMAYQENDQIEIFRDISVEIAR